MPQAIQCRWGGGEDTVYHKLVVGEQRRIYGQEDYPQRHPDSCHSTPCMPISYRRYCAFVYTTTVQIGGLIALSRHPLKAFRGCMLVEMPIQKVSVAYQKVDREAFAATSGRRVDWEIAQLL